MTQIGSVIDGKYEILTEIGRGGMSVVYLAMDKRLNKQWAVKEVRKRGVSKNDEVVVNSLMAEANLIKRLDHPAFPRIVDIIDNGQTIYIVMDYIEGESLDKILEEHGAQSEDNVIHWAMQICDALNYLHSQKPHPIIYRDMKPANLMLKPEGEYGIIKIIDFGIAREFKDKNLADTTVLGTRGYASPEHYAGHTDVRSDIFSLGMTMHHLLTGVDPRKGEQYASVRNWNPDLSEGIEIIVDKCVQPAPENRYQNCDELLRDLNDPSKLTHNYRKKQKRKLWTFLGAIIISVVMLVAGFVLKGTAEKINSDDYENLIGVADSTPYETKVAGYKKAIALYPKDLRGYSKLLDAYASDNSFTATENGEFSTIYNRYRSQLDTNDPDVCELRYKIGALYLTSYTENGGNDTLARAKLAYQYFEENYYSNAGYEHKTISDCYYWVCYLYKVYLAGSGSSMDDEPEKQDYEALFEEINNRIEKTQDTNANNKLKLYSVVFYTLYGKRNDMAKLGVSQTLVLDLFDTVYRLSKDLVITRSDNLEYQKELQDNYAAYREAIVNAYVMQERSDGNG